MIKFYKHIIFLSFFSLVVVKSSAQGRDLPNPPANLQTVTVGSLVIPMDNSHQNLTAPFNLKAYGLVNALLQNDIPVKWVIRSGKLKDGIDFSATAERAYPTFLAASLQDFRASAFIIDSTWVNKSPYANWGQTAAQIIAAFGGNVAVYRLTQNVTVDVRYTLIQRPKIAIFSNGGNQNIHKIILDNAGIPNYTIISAGVFTGLAECYTFCSEPHWASKITDTAIMRKPVEFIYSGGNFFAQCHAVQTGTTDGYETHMKIQSTNAFSEIGINTTLNTYYNPDMAIMQFHGLMKASQGGSGKNWKLAPGSSWRNGHYYAVSTQNARDTVVVSCAKLTNPADAGGNVFYMGGHQYLGDFTDIELLNSGRIYLNAALLPATRPGAFVITTGPNSAICNGQQTQLSVTGVPGATYLWSPSASLNNPTSATPIATPTVTTTYGVSAMNGSCPGGPAFVTVTVKPIPVAPIAGSSSPVCVGSALTLSASTISGATYNWTGPNGFSSSVQNPVISGVTSANAGTYSATATINGCTGPAGTTSVIINPTPSSTLSQNNVSCFGGSNGSASVVASGGTPSYTYLWSNAQTTSSATGLIAGNYNVTITDSKGCKVITAVSITQPLAPLTSSSSQINVSCFGGNNGSASVIPTGGTPSYTYLWSNGQTASSATGLIAGTYSVTTSDSKACTNVISVTITQPAVLSANVSQTNVSCYGGNNGSALVSTPSGGTPDYSYIWSNGQIGSSITELAIGAYSLTVTDSKGCTVNASATITQPVAALSFTSSQTNVSCFGGNNGSASVIAAGGTPGYSYLWLPGNQTASSISNLTIGTYTITITDAKGCSVIGFKTITQPAALTVSFSNQTNVSCFAGNNGSVTANAAGGIQNYTYLWMPGNASTAVINNLTVGTYTITVTDNLSCQVQNNVTITQPAAALSVSVSSVPKSCFGGTNGSVASVASAGTGPYTYNWIPGNYTTQNVSSLLAGNYTVTVTDSKSCTIANSVTVNQPSQISLATGTTNSTCGLANGTANVSISGGISPYTYQWSPNGGTTDTAKNLFSGAYTVIVSDANACNASKSLNVNDNNSPTVTIISSTNVSCNGGSTGTASGGISGGTGPFIYSWAPYGGNSANATGLIAGTYTLTVIDSNGCQSLATTSPAITEPAAVLLTVTTTNVSCFGGNNGTAAVSASGGTPGYTYLWSNGSTSAQISNLTSQTYTVQVTDTNSCVKTTSFLINQPNQLNTVITASGNVSCFGGNDGMATVGVSGGTPFYNYNWLPTGGNGSTGTGLSVGTYTVNVIDFKACNSSVTILITEPLQALSSITSQSNVSCYGGNDGTSAVTASGGTPAYSYLWDNGQTNSTNAGLAAGNYVVTTKDAKGCSTTESITITQPAMALSSTTSQNNVSCFGGSGGSASVIASGGTPSYTYLWSNGQTTSTAIGLIAGNYNVTVTDFKGCITTASVSITQPVAPLTSSSSQTNVSCFGGSDGSASVIPTGGTSSYTYLWSNGATTAQISNLTSQIYTVTSTDSKNCTTVISITITEPALLSSNISQTNVSCYGGNNGSAIVSSPSGGTPPYSYLWSNGQISSSITELIVGTYSLTVTDAKGCTVAASATITQPIAPLTLTTSQTNVSCFGGNNGSASAIAADGTPGYSYLWMPGNQTSGSISNLTIGTYTITITDANGCIAIGFTAITQPPVLAVNFINQTNVSCFGGNNGSVTANATGGIQNYTYLWMPGNVSTAAINNLPIGTYSVTVTDNLSCQVQNNVTITQPMAALSVSVTSTPTSCYGGTDGTAASSPSDGTAPYTYNWVPGNNTTQNDSSISAGTYTVTVMDSKLCALSSSVTVNQPAQITLIPGTINSTCGLPNGTAYVSVSGGAGSYTYQWSPGGGNSDTARNLLSGAYTVLVTDANGCVASQSLNVNDNNSPSVTIISKTNVTCNGGATGTAGAGISGGTGPFTYSWAPYGGNTPNASGLTAGTYTLTVLDANGCQSLATTSPAITEPSTLELIVTKTEVSCFGGSNGSASVSVSGGTPGYTYLWSNGSTSSQILNLTSQNYTVQVTDTNSCVQTTSFSINEPDQLIAVISSSANVSCWGGNNGTATANVTGGTPFYNYNWLPTGGNGPTGTGFSAGTYTVNVVDLKGCVSSAVILITEPSQALSSVTSQSNVFCFGGNDGTAAVLASGGTLAYSYLWNTGQTSSTIGGLTAGNYVITTTDANACTTSSSISITQPAMALSAITSQTDVSCFGGSNGSATVIATGGTPSYTYLWSNGATTSQISNLTSQIYTVTVTDYRSCLITTASVSISQPAAPLSSTNSQTNVSCLAGSNGSASIFVSGGTSPYTYLWNNGQTNSTATGLIAGTYTVTYTDLNACTSSASIVITQPLALNAAVSQTNVSCYGGSNGFISVSASGGTPFYTYLWSNGQSSSSITGQSAGTFSVIVTDTKGCTITSTASITQPAVALSFSNSQTNVSCLGGNNGSALVIPTGGTPGYSYIWSNGQTTSQILNLPSQTYTITVTDTKGCTATGFTTITEPAVLAVGFINQTNVSCFAGNNGAITADASGGTQNYNYLWMPGNLSTASIGDLLAGTYTVTVTDNMGCQVQNNVTITQPVSALSVSVSSSLTSCYGGTDGSLSSSVIGGTGSYTYNWLPGNYTTQNVSNVSAGNYSVTVTDLNGCFLSNAVTVNQPSQIILITGTVSSTCTFANGSANVSVSGGIGSYTYQWSPSGGNSATAINLFSGAYTVLVTDANGCSAQQWANVNDFPSPSVTILSSTNVTCNGGFTGTASAGPYGGTAPFSYSWAPYGGNSSIAIGLAAGTYTLTVVDSNGCQSIATTTPAITEPPVIALTVTTTDVSCFGGSNGTAAVTATGGTPGYTYLWSNGSTSSQISNLTSQIYSVQVTDANNCIKTASFSINQPIQIGAAISSSSNVSCWGGNNGTATASVTGGTPFYSYNWLPIGGNGPTGTGLSAGTYTVNVVDIKGCSSSATILITQPLQALSSVTSQIDVSCFGGTNGSALVTASGGTISYTYLWNNGQTGSSVTGLTAGNYVITTTDSKGCIATGSIFVGQPVNPLTLITSQNNVSCFGGNDGSASVSPFGGTSSYTYLWNGGQTTSFITGLALGNYNVTVTDSKGCSTTASVLMSEPSTSISSVSSQTNVSCFGGSNGSASINASNGTPSYTYQWSNGQTVSSIVGLAAGNYSVIITDANGCVTMPVISIVEPTFLSSTAAQTNICSGASNGLATVSVAGGTSPYSYLWSDGQTTSSATGLSVGNYSVTSTDAKGCITMASVSITLFPSISSTMSQTDISCYGGNNGSVSIVASGGTNPFSYQWNNGLITSAITGLFSGNYSVTVTDSNGCKTTGSASLTQPVAPLSAAISQNNVSCFGGSNGSVSVSTSGGTSAYTYLWDSGQTNSFITGLIAGNYNVTVTDSKACKTLASVSIVQPASALSTSSSQSNLSCFGDSNGSASVSASGGTPSYTYLWSNGQTNSSITSLVAGNYFSTTTDANGCISNDSISISEPVVLSSSAIQTNICSGASNGLATVSASGGTLPYTYLWSNGQTALSATGLAVGNYSVTSTDAKGCLTSATVAITLFPAISSLTSQTNVSCNGGTNGSATIIPSGGTPPFTYQWNNGPSSSSFTGLIIGNYTATVTDANGCQTTSSALIIEPSLFSTSIGSIVNATCFNGFNGSAIATATGGVSPYAYNWSTSPVQTTNGATNLSAGTHTLTVTDSNGCITTNTVNIAQPSQVITIAGSNDSVCLGQSGTVTATASGGWGGYSYTWLPSTITNSGTLAVTPSGNETYTVTAQDQYGCIGTPAAVSAIIYQLNPANIQVSGSSPICAGQSSVISVQTSGTTGTLTYLWNNNLGTGAGPYTVIPSQPTTYLVTVTNECGSSVTEGVQILFNPPPTVNLTSDINQACIPVDIQFNDNSVSGNNTDPISNWYWDFGDGTSSTLQNPNHAYTQSGIYSVILTVTTSGGCTNNNASSPLIITAHPIPSAVFSVNSVNLDLPYDVLVCTNQSVGASSYNWSFGDGGTSNLVDPQNLYTTVGIFLVQLIAISPYGCSDTTYATITTNADVIFPNVFTPNTNGVGGETYNTNNLNNDIFFPYTSGVVDYKLEIFNRWGEEIFESLDVKQGWNGYYKGALCQQDVYVWKAYIKLNNGKVFNKNGDVTLLR